MNNHTGTLNIVTFTLNIVNPEAQVPGLLWILYQVPWPQPSVTGNCRGLVPVCQQILLPCAMLHAVLHGGSILSALFLCVVVERSSFDWLTGSSIDLMADYTVFASESLSSSLLFSHKKSEKSQRVSWKSVGPDFGTKKLGLPGDEVDNQVKSGKLTAGTAASALPPYADA